MLASISVILVAFVRIPLVPAAPFLVYDMADAPVLIGTLLFGPVPGMTILLVVSHSKAQRQKASSKTQAGRVQQSKVKGGT